MLPVHSLVVVCVVLQEKDALLQKDFQEQAFQMQRQIDSLRSEMHKEEKSKPSIFSGIVDGIGAAAKKILPGFVTKWFK